MKLKPTVNGFITMLNAKINQYDQRKSLKDPYHNSNFMSLAYESVENRITSKFKARKLLDSSDHEVLLILKALIPKAILIKAVTGSVVRAIDAYIEKGKIPKYPVVKRKASEVIRNLEMRIASLEKLSTQSLSKKAGRRYDDDEWVFFIHEETGLEDDREGNREAERLKEKFEDCIDQLCDKHDLSICYDDGVSRVAFKAYASLAGHGTGLWDHDHPEAEKLEILVKRDRKCGDLASQIEDLPYNLGLA